MKLLPILRREYMERIRSKAFIIGTIVGPLLLVALMVLPSVLMDRQRGRPLTIAVLDASGQLQKAIEQALSAQTAQGLPRFAIRAPGAGGLDERRARLKSAVLDGSLDGYLYLPPDAVASSRAEYYGRNVSNFPDIGLMDRAVEDALIGARLMSEGLAEGRIQGVMQRLALRTIRVSASGEREDHGASFFLSMTLLMTLYTTIAMWGAALMNGVIEEKANRVVEIVVSSVPPARLFAGKLLGVGAVGLTQFLAWSLLMAGLSFLSGRAGGVKLPEIPPLVIALFILFFLLGYFLYGAMYASVGAAVNSQQEAQSLVFPVMMPLILGVMFFPMVLASPDSPMSVAISLVPFWTPLLMFLRVSALQPPAWQIVLSIALTLGTTVVLTWGASRIYRVGILMHGKRPTFPEILRWIRHT